MRFPQLPFRAALLAAVLAGCHQAPVFVAPASPEGAVRTFLDAVKANNMTAMSQSWGSERGPASRTMTHNDSTRSAMEQRLTIMRIYLDHDRYEILPAREGALGGTSRRRIEVRLYRKGCTPVVPFTVVRAGNGWLVSEIELSAAGNPAVPCQNTGG